MVHINETVTVIPEINGSKDEAETFRMEKEKEKNEKTRFKELSKEHEDNVRWKNSVHEEEDIC